MSDPTRWRDHQDRWARKRLEPSLERSPERRQRFITQSGVDIERVYTPADLADPANDPDVDRPRYRFSPPVDGREGWDEIDDLGLPGEPPFTRGIHPTGHRGRLWTMRMFAGYGTAEDTNARFKTLIREGGTGLSIAYDMPTLYGYDHDEPQAEGEFGTCGVAVSSLADMEILLDGLPVGEISTSMTINSPAAMIWAMYIVAAEKAGVPTGAAVGHAPERHPQGVHRPEGVHLPARAVAQARDRHRRVGHPRASEVEHDLDQRLSHPRGGIDGRPGAGVHDRRRHCLRRGRAGPRPPLRRLRPAPVVLLQLAQRLLRGDREVPRRAADLVQARPRTVRRRKRALDVDALPHPDRRRVAHGPAAAEQPDSSRDPGAGRGARRDPVAPYRCVRRGVGGSLRGGRTARVAAAADPRRGGRSREHGRPAGRLVLRRDADEPDRAGGVALHRPDRRDGRDGEGARGRLPPGRDRRCRLRAAARARGARARDRRCHPLRRRRTRSCGSRCSR